MNKVNGNWCKRRKSSSTRFNSAVRRKRKLSSRATNFGVNSTHQNQTKSTLRQMGTWAFILEERGGGANHVARTGVVKAK